MILIGWWMAWRVRRRLKRLDVRSIGVLEATLAVGRGSFGWVIRAWPHGPDKPLTRLASAEDFGVALRRAEANALVRRDDYGEAF